MSDAASTCPNCGATKHARFRYCDGCAGDDNTARTALAERDEARRLARHLAIRLSVLRRGDLQGPERAMCEFAMRYPDEPDVSAPAPWIPSEPKDTP